MYTFSAGFRKLSIEPQRGALAPHRGGGAAAGRRAHHARLDPQGDRHAGAPLGPAAGAGTYMLLHL